MATAISPPTSPHPVGAIPPHISAMQRPKPSMVRPVSRPRSTSRVSMSSRHGAATRLSDDDSKTAVKVAVRVRPGLRTGDPGYDLIPQRFRQSMVQVPSPTSLTVESSHGKKLFVFDRVFGPEVDQEGVWDYVSESVNSFLQGYNVSILAYGQSGAGKSYTMGTTDPNDQEDPRIMGIVPRAAAALFENLCPNTVSKSGIRSPNRYSLSSMTAQSNSSKVADKDWKMTATYVEIYQEQLRDLLIDESVPFSDRPQVSIREDAKGRIILTGLKQISITSIEDLINALNFGSSIRQTDSTAINARSSRSHAVFSINLVQKKGQGTTAKDRRRSVPIEAMSGSDNFISVDSKLHFVDLAGSERLKNTGAHGERAKEGISINAGLASLGKVISQLSSRQQGTHVSYRDSRLTRLLQDSLGGNAITYMVACVNPAEFHLSETLNTVTYAQRARAIQSKPQIQVTTDESDKQAAIERLKAEVQFLRDQIRLSEKNDRNLPPQERSERNHKREVELQNQLLDIQENYNALSQRHAKLISEISNARNNESGDTSSSKETVGSATLDRMKRAASFQQSVESIVLEYEKTIETLEASLSNTRSSLSNSESILLEKETSLAYIETHNRQLESRLQKAMDRELNDQNYLRDLETRLTGANTDEEKAATMIDSLKKELTRIRESEAGAEDYISTLEEKLAETEQQHENMAREIERLEHVVDRQRSIKKLDNILYELDNVRTNDTKLKQSFQINEPIQEEDTESFHSFKEDENNNDAQTRQDSPILSINEDEAIESIEQINGSSTPTPETAEVHIKLDDSEDGPSPAQTKFVNDKLESVTQELFELRVDHEGTITELDQLQHKYQVALTTLAELQDSIEDAKAQNLSRPMSIITEKNFEDSNHATRDLSTELLSTEMLSPGSTDGLDSLQTPLSTASAFTATSQREDELAEENEILKKQHAEKEESLVELKQNLDNLKDKHQETLNYIEELKSKNITGRSSPTPGILRRKERSSVLSDRANRSFVAVRALIHECFEEGSEKQQAFENSISVILNEFSIRSDRLIHLESETQALRKELDSKTALITGLTRERSSFKASPLDIGRISTLENQLKESESRVRSLTSSHSTKEKELLEQIDQLRLHLENTRSSNSSLTDSEHTREINDDPAGKIVTQLQKEVEDWRSKHDSAIESMKASEKQFLATINDLETNLKNVEQQASRSVSPEDMHNFELERQHLSDTIQRLQKEVGDHKAATMLTTQRLAELQESYIKLLEQTDRENQNKASTLKELDTHKNLIQSLETQLEEHKTSVASHQKAFESLRSEHASAMEALSIDHANAQKEVNNKLKASIEEHQQVTAALKVDLDNARNNSQSSRDSVESELISQKEKMTNLLADASMILGRPANVKNITSHIQTLVNARKDIAALHEDASRELQLAREELDSLKSHDLESRLNELKEENETLSKRLDSITEKELKSSRLVEELELQLESNYNKGSSQEALAMKQELEQQLNEARSRISVLENELSESREGGGLHRSNSSRSEAANNMRKSTIPSPPPTIPLPPLPATPMTSTGAVSPPPLQPATISPPSSRHTSKDLNTAQLVEDQEARIRTIEKHLFAEKQLTATLEEALTDLESSSTKMKADMEAWRRKCSVLEEELLLLRREKQNTRLSVQQMEDEARKRIDLERAKLEERMQQLTNMSKKQKKKSSINCF